MTCRSDVKPGTFQARDNVSNFISWCRNLGIPDVLRFETDDLVLRKNEKSVILCLLELARVGAKLGMLAPTIVRMEQEIDEELESGEPPPQIKTCDMKSLDELVSFWGVGGWVGGGWRGVRGWRGGVGLALSASFFAFCFVWLACLVMLLLLFFAFVLLVGELFGDVVLVLVVVVLLLLRRRRRCRCCCCSSSSSSSLFF